ncbi:hypothetical protein BJF92_18220 [Rhizobium rhizosphaerae]|uniref:4'-phosphopantetheinyl transferase domain-containing protein n=1 Tax=Xaviernesmea rhizosphaerae TaxID=1672749 RepID=A0A1Q9ADI2_9HYPH|nr:4'-phosphopantetheinyl transferase superfamily protein [Xaviernesmea rhizosphaerae]OLP52975.1 hypothetical protein BJF92_18220 [Xaviernesmea rhizosphaerae]
MNQQGLRHRTDRQPAAETGEGAQPRLNRRRASGLLPHRLPQDAVHLHLVDDTQVTDPARLQTYARLLTDDETRRAAAFHAPEHRHQFLITRALLRRTLTHYCPGTPAQDWRFTLNAYGRPAIDGGFAIGLDFNLSHTRGRIALAICRDPSPGVDIEWLDRRVDYAGIADLVLTPDEQRDLAALPEALRAQRFTALWTLKEAYVKARGMGLSIPLREIAVSFDGSGQPSIRFGGSLEDDPQRWQVWSLREGPAHRLALALAAPTPRRIRIFRGIPS